MAGIEEEVKVVLHLMKVLYDFDVPAEFTADVKTELIDLNRFLMNLEDPGYAEPVSAAEFYRRNLSAINGTMGKLIFITGDLFPSVPFMKKRYGCRTAFGRFALLSPPAGQDISYSESPEKEPGRIAGEKMQFS